MRSFGDEDSIFVNLDRLNPNTQTYQPDSLPSEKRELNQLHSTLKPAAMGSTPLNAFVFGPTGQGKTVGVKLKTNQLRPTRTTTAWTSTWYMSAARGWTRATT